MSITYLFYLLYWYFQQNQCLNIKKHAINNIHRLTWPLRSRGPRATAQRVHTLRRHCLVVDQHLNDACLVTVHPTSNDCGIKTESL